MLESIITNRPLGSIIHLCDSNETDLWIRMQVPLELLVPWDINTNPDQCVFHNVSVSTVEWVSCRNIILAPLMSNQLKSSLIFTWSAKPLALKDTISIPVYINYYKYCLICGPFALKNIYTITFGYTQVIATHTYTQHTFHSCVQWLAIPYTTPHEICINALIMGSFITQSYCYFFHKGQLVLFSVTCLACGKFCNQPTDSGLKVGILETVIF